MARKKIAPIAQTNFEMVTDFNEVLGQGVATTPRIPSLAQCRLRASLIAEEAVKELSTALDKRDLIGVADAIGDALVVVYGAANDCGLDADEIFAEIHRSNMSKLCANEEEAKEAVARYAAGDGFHGKFTPIAASYRPCTHPNYQGSFVVYDTATNKTLKGPQFSEPNLVDVIYGQSGLPFDPHSELRIKAAAKMTGEELWLFNEKLDMLVGG